MANQDFAQKYNDLVFIDGDIAVQESDVQHVADTLNAFPGWWKEYPEDGVGIFRYINGAGFTEDLRRSTKINLQRDNYRCDPKISIDANGNVSFDPNVII